MKFFEKIIQVTKGLGFVKLVSTNPDTHMNVIVSEKGDPWLQSGVTLTVNKALQVRDALNEAYPNEGEFKFRKIPEYTRVDRWEVYRNRVGGWSDDRVCITNREANAKKITQALNEAEGL